MTVHRFSERCSMCDEPAVCIAFFADESAEESCVLHAIGSVEILCFGRQHREADCPIPWGSDGYPDGMGVRE
jgi:hypothetical protein